MSKSIRLDESLIDSARTHGKASNRSAPKQIEHWVMLGRILEQNPELSYAFIVELIRARAQVNAGEVTEYRLG